MKRALLALAILACRLDAAYFVRTITVDHTKVPNTDQTNFTAVVSGTFTYLKTAANGGRIQHTATQTGGGASITVPADFLIASDSGCTTKLNFEFGTYTATTGVTTFYYNQTQSHTADTIAYMCYGNTATTTYQGNVNATWDSNYEMVQHFPDGTTLTANDSTSNALNGTLVNTPTATAGQINGAANFASASSQYIQRSSGFPTTWTTFTISMWFKLTTLPPGGDLAVGLQSSQSANGWLFGINTTGHPDITERGVANNPFSSLTVTANTKVYYLAITRSTTTAIGYLYNFTDSTNANQTITINNTAFTGDGKYLISSLDAQAAGFFWNGWIDELRVSTSVRSADWIQTSYNNQSSPSTFYTIGAETGGTPSAGGPIIQ